MKSKFLLTLLVAFALSLSVLAKDVSQSQAEKVAINFFFEKSNVFNKTVDFYDLSITNIVKADDAYYVVNLDNGWVLIAADDAMVPVLGYNYDGKFAPSEQQGDNVKSYLKHFVDQINFIRENNIEADNEVTDQWDHYLNSKPGSLLAYRGNRDQVEPLLTNMWNQDSPYNILCPEDPEGPGGHVLVGCVATAMSQIMYYWRYPWQGSGYHSYYASGYGTQSVNYGEAYYDFNAMQDEIDNGNPWEIAKLGYHAAVSVNMNFGPTGSGANVENYVPYALETYFNYDNSCQWADRGDYTLPNWKIIIQGELDNLHPINYVGYTTESGHSFVCDGYDGDDYYHFNFGWSGNDNGFYTLSDVNGFHYDQQMVYNIIPEDPDYPYVAEGETVLTSVSGSFTDGSGPAEDYPSGMDASWLIDPQTETDSIIDITLSFLQFNTAASDYLRVYDGGTTSDDLIGEFSGDELPGNITSSGNKMLITFTSTGSESGFKAEYSTMSPTFCSGVETYSDPSGTITDGSENFYYNNDATCVFKIDHPEGVNYNLEFTSFSTEEDADVVEIIINGGETIAVFSGADLPEVLEIETDMVIIAWTTNATVNDEGWSLNYTIDGVGVKESFEYDNLNIYPNPTNGQLNISFDVEKTENLEVQLINISGQIIQKDIINGFSGHYKNNFDLSNQAKGVYILSIISDKGKVDKKVVVK